MASVIVIKGDGDKKTQRTVELREKVSTVGRSPASTIPIDDKAASRKHCMIKVENDAFTLIDLGSANGTSVNGERVKEHLLGTGDRIQIGNTVLVFKE